MRKVDSFYVLEGQELISSARLKLLGANPFAREAFTSLVITGTIVVMCLLRMSVGMGSKLHDFVADFMMTLCTSSSLASLKVVKVCFTSGGCDSNRGGAVMIRLSKSLRIFSILVEKYSQNESAVFFAAGRDDF